MKYKQEEIKPYSIQGDKTEQVKEMFNKISPKYDLLNRILSLGIDKSWRKKAIKALKDHHPQYVLDLATGTGDFAITSVKMLSLKKLVGVDLSEGMLKIGEKKVKELGLDNIIKFELGDAMHLNFSDETFDAITIAFGVRNFSDLDKGLKEMHRTLKSNGRLIILELSTPVLFPLKQLFNLYSHSIMPVMGGFFSKDKRAYNYLPASLEAFPQGEEMQKILLKAGYSEVDFRRFTGGLCTMYSAKK